MYAIPCSSHRTRQRTNATKRCIADTGIADALALFAIHLQVESQHHTQQQWEEVRHRPLSHLGTKTNIKSSNARDDNAAH